MPPAPAGAGVPTFGGFPGQAAGPVQPQQAVPLIGSTATVRATSPAVPAPEVPQASAVRAGGDPIRVGPFTLREALTVLAGGLVLLLSFFSLTGYVYHPIWALPGDLVLTTLVPLAAVGLIVARRLGKPSLRVGSFGVDQLAAVAGIGAVVGWIDVLSRAADTPTQWFGLVLALGLVVLTVVAPMIPGLREDFTARPALAPVPFAQGARVLSPRPRAPRSQAPVAGSAGVQTPSVASAHLGPSAAAPMMPGQPLPVPAPSGPPAPSPYAAAPHPQAAAVPASQATPGPQDAMAGARSVASTGGTTDPGQRPVASDVPVPPQAAPAPASPYAPLGVAWDDQTEIVDRAPRTPDGPAQAAEPGPRRRSDAGFGLHVDPETGPSDLDVFATLDRDGSVFIGDVRDTPDAGAAPHREATADADAIRRATAEATERATAAAERHAAEATALAEADAQRAASAAEVEASRALAHAEQRDAGERPTSDTAWAPTTANPRAIAGTGVRVPTNLERNELSDAGVYNWDAASTADSPSLATAAADPAHGTTHQAFWALAPVERAIVDESGATLFHIGPTAWALVIQDRGNAFVVRHADGRVGFLTDVTGVIRN